MSSIDLTRRHYRELLESDHVEGEHPADLLVANLPEVCTVDEAARSMSTEMRKSETRRRSAASWTEYEDLRFEQRCIREERFFDVGYEMGWQAGIAQYGILDVRPEAASARRQVQRVLVSSGLSWAEMVAVLLDAMRSFLSSPAASAAEPPKPR